MSPCHPTYCRWNLTHSRSERHPLRRFFLLIACTVAAGVAVLFSTSGHFLIVNDPRPADIIVVLAGESNQRPALGLELLHEGYAPKMLLDVPEESKIYSVNLLDIASSYVRGLPEEQSVEICPIAGLSTKAETSDVLRCVRQTGARHILLVTSDFHTRRALSIFQHELTGYEFFVAAARDQQEFGSSWWRNRQWAKVNLDEWIRLVWWELVDRWR